MSCYHFINLIQASDIDEIWMAKAKENNIKKKQRKIVQKANIYVYKCSVFGQVTNIHFVHMYVSKKKALCAVG